jgi:hypothetical protein
MLVDGEHAADGRLCGVETPADAAGLESAGQVPAPEG